MNWTAPVTIALGLLAAEPAFAHHSFAMFDRTRTIEVTGTVKEFQWTNPHVWIQLWVPDAAGKQVEYGFEANAVRSLTQAGWTRRTFNPGDKIKIVYNPLRAGGNGGAFVTATLADGTVLRNSAQAAPAAQPAAPR